MKQYILYKKKKETTAISGFEINFFYSTHYFNIFIRYNIYVSLLSVNCG